MPMKNGMPHCVNHPDTPMRKQDGLNAITVMKVLPDGQTTFIPDSGIPTVVYYCDHCGYLEMYAAAKTQYWPAQPAKP